MKKKKSTWDAQCFFQSQKLVTAILPMISNMMKWGEISWKG